MFLDTMTPKEIVDAKDREEHALDNVIKTEFQRIRRIVLKDGRFPRQHFFFAKVNRSRNEYLVCILLLDKRRTSAGFYRQIRMPLITYPSLQVIEVTYNTYTCYKYVPHFFDRYQERMASIIPDIETMDRRRVILTYFRRNAMHGMQTQEKVRKGKIEWELAVNDGAVMCNLNLEAAAADDFVTCKTFVRDDMMYREQRDRKNSSEMIVGTAEGVKDCIDRFVQHDNLQYLIEHPSRCIGASDDIQMPDVAEFLKRNKLT